MFGANEIARRLEDIAGDSSEAVDRGCEKAVVRMTMSFWGLHMVRVCNSITGKDIVISDCMGLNEFSLRAQGRGAE